MRWLTPYSNLHDSSFIFIFFETKGQPASAKMNITKGKTRPHRGEVLLDFVFKAFSHLLMRHKSHIAWTQCLYWPPFTIDCSHCRTRSNFILCLILLSSTMCFFDEFLLFKAPSQWVSQPSPSWTLRSTLSFNNTYDLSSRVMAMLSILLRRPYTGQLI